MSYSDYDLSIHDGAPIECYKFIGELATYRYTNNNAEVTVNGELYEPLSGIKRTAIETSSLLDSVQTIDVEVPITCAMAAIYNFLRMPLTLNLEIRSVHRGSNFATDWKKIWNGQSVTFPVVGNNATVRTQSVIQSVLSGQLNDITYQTPCNHEVYDTGCTLNPALFTTTSTITDIKDNVITVGATGVADGDLAIGKLVNTRTTESRIIVSNVGHVITIGYGFLDVQLGDTINMVKGCDNAYTTCDTRFSNLLNFGAFMFLPIANPFTDHI